MATETVTCDCTEQTMQEQGMAQGRAGMKKCPYCAEQIQAEAVKCRYCGEFLDRSRQGPPPLSPPSVAKKKWYFTTGSVVLALLCLGPLALPLVWLNPRYKPLTRVFITLLVIAVTGLCIYAMAAMYQHIFSQFDAMGM